MTFDFDMLREADAVIAAFEKAGIRYALAGGFAVAIYGRIRATKDMDFLCHPEDVERAAAGLAGIGYQSHAEPWTFQESAMTLHRFMKPGRESELFHVVDVLVPPPDRLEWISAAERLAWGRDGQVRVVSRAHLIEMKKLRNSALDRSDMDFLEGRT
jgi:hypothetical protein